MAILLALGAALAAQAQSRDATAEAKLGSPLPPWSAGELDIHQIATGRGNAALVIGPDGTSILIDAGAANGSQDVSSASRPNATRRPGEWIARYILRQLKPVGSGELDYFVATHLHPDHTGDVGADTPPAKAGDFVLTGITDVAALIPIRKVIDRGFPDYAYPSRWPAGFALNYFAYIASRQKNGGLCERIRVGADDQIRLLKDPTRFPHFAVRNLAANGVVWTKEGPENVHSAVPPLRDLSPAEYPDENMCSIALLLSYGKFDYYTGGDLHCDTWDGKQPWRDVESLATRAAGPVEVAVADHHAYFDAVGPEAVRNLQPLVWVVPAWHITHVSIGPLGRMLSEHLYPGPRDVFVTDLMPATALIDQRFLPKVKSTSGNIVIRVCPGGDRFWIYITDNNDESDTIKASFGPYQCK